jgi:hypothetical protein
MNKINASCFGSLFFWFGLQIRVLVLVLVLHAGVFVFVCKIKATRFPFLSPLCRPEGPEEGARAPWGPRPQVGPPPLLFIIATNPGNLVVGRQAELYLLVSRCACVCTQVYKGTWRIYIYIYLRTGTRMGVYIRMGVWKFGSWKNAKPAISQPF